MVARLVTLLVLHTALAGCYAQEPAAEPATATRQAVEACQVVARINNQVILASEVLWQVNLIIQDNRDRIPPDKVEEVRDQLMRNQLTGLVDLKLLWADFKQKTDGKADMKAIEDNLKEPFEKSEIPKLMKALQLEDRQQLEPALAALGTSLAERRQAFMERAIASQWLRESIKVEKVEHIDLVQAYQSRLAEYEFPTQARWEELMVRFDSHPTRDAAMSALGELGNQVWPQVQANPASTAPLFGEVAKAKSQGYTASEGGQHDWTSQGALLDTQLDEALFALPVGAMSPILESALGYHIVRVLERREAGRKPLGEVQEELRKQLEDERFDKAAGDKLATLRRNARIWTVYTGNTTAAALLGPPNQRR